MSRRPAARRSRFQADVAEGDSVAAMVAVAESGLGRVDILFNNAGVMLSEDRGPEDTEMAIWDRTIAINLTGVFPRLPFRHPGAAPGRRRGDPQHVLPGRHHGLRGAADWLYTASKGGCHGDDPRDRGAVWPPGYPLPTRCCRAPSARR